MTHPGFSFPILKLYRALRNLVILLALAFPFSMVSAQQENPDRPYYVVRPGDSLWDISVAFGVPVEDIERVNGIANPNQLNAGMKLIIPGLTGFAGEIAAREIPLGDSLYRTSYRYGLPLNLLVQLNHITSPASVYAGASLLLPATNERKKAASVPLSSGQSILDLGMANNLNPWSVMLNNGLSSEWEALPGENLFVLTPQNASGGDLMRSEIHVSVDPVKLKQGKTIEIKVSGPPGMNLSGRLGDADLQFFPIQDGYVALQGVHAMAEPGLSTLTIQGQYPAGSFLAGQPYSFSQSLQLESGDYPMDPVLTVNPETIDPAVTKPEDALWKSLGSRVTPDKLWDGAFVSPVPQDFKDCWTSLFGNRRSYNNGPYEFFHSGLDFCGREGTELYAAAAGTVVYTGSLKVRGNVTVINHGRGLYTAYDHQSEIFVKVGDSVTPGQRIGLGGSTGRTTGPHLHWEVWVGGVAVDPVDWLKKTYP